MAARRRLEVIASHLAQYPDPISSVQRKFMPSLIDGFNHIRNPRCISEGLLTYNSALNSDLPGFRLPGLKLKHQAFFYCD